MKKILLPFLLFCALNVAAEKQNVAVYVTGPDKTQNKIFGDQFVTAFSRSNEYVAVERTTSFLTELSKEQSYQEGGAVDNNQITRLGKQFGANFVCVVEIMKAYGEYYISARLINVESAEVLKTSSAISKLSSVEQIIEAADKMTHELTGVRLNTQKNLNTQQNLNTQKSQAEIEKEKQIKEIKKGIDRGYIRVGDLYVMIKEKHTLTFSEAKRYAKNCEYGRIYDWRLPTRNELISIRNEFIKYEEYHVGFHSMLTGGDHYCWNYWCQDGTALTSNGGLSFPSKLSWEEALLVAEVPYYER